MFNILNVFKSYWLRFLLIIHLFLLNGNTYVASFFARASQGLGGVSKKLNAFISMQIWIQKCFVISKLNQFFVSKYKFIWILYLKFKKMTIFFLISSLWYNTISGCGFCKVLTKWLSNYRYDITEFLQLYHSLILSDDLEFASKCLIASFIICDSTGYCYIRILLLTS